MKRFIALAVALLLALSILPINSFAAENADSYDEIIYLDNGFHITVQTTQNVTRGTAVKGAKTYTFRDINGKELWAATLTGIFSCDGTSATCLSAGSAVTITDTTWSEVSKTVSKSGNTARLELEMVRKFLGITVQEESLTFTLTCSPNGVFS